jgi:hypothetical protein
LKDSFYGCAWKRKEVGSLWKRELRIRPGGGEKLARPLSLRQRKAFKKD